MLQKIGERNIGEKQVRVPPKDRPSALCKKNEGPNSNNENTIIQNLPKIKAAEAWMERDLAKSGITVEMAEILNFELVGKEEITSILGFTPDTGDKPLWGYTIPYFDPESGEPILCPNEKPFIRIRLMSPAVIPDEDGKSKTAKYLSPKKAGMHPFITKAVHDKLMKNPETPVYLVEGEKKSIRASQEGIPVIGLCGIWGWMKGKGNKSLHSMLLPYMSSKRPVIVIYDSDATDTPEKTNAFNSCTTSLADTLLDYSTFLVRLDMPRLSTQGKTGLDDYFEKGKTLADFYSLLKAEETKLYPRPEIVLSGESIIEPAAIAAKALACRREFFLRVPNIKATDGTLVFRDEDGRMVPKTPIAMCSEIERVANIRKKTKKGKVKTKIIEQQSKEILHSRDFKTNCLKLTAITKYPVLVERDGDLRTIHGYDPETGIFASGVPVEGVDMENAVTTLRQLFCEFNFHAPSDEARFFANLISPSLVLS